MTIGRAWPSSATASLSGGAIIAGATVALAFLAAVAVPNFFTESNIRAVFLSVSLIGIVAVGLSLITIVGKIFSLSIPSLTALSTIVFASTLGFGPWIATFLTVLMASLVGLVQGIVVGRFRTDPIIATIAAGAIMLGVGQLWTSGRTIVGHGDASLFNSNVLGLLPFQSVAFVAVTLALYWWHTRTVAGRKLSLIGLNERAARISGLPGWPLVTLAFVVSAATTGLAGALLSAQSGQGTLLLGSGFGFDAIVAVVVGGVVITGGQGTPISAAVGAVFVGLLNNVLALLGLPYEIQLVVKGVLVLIAVVAMGAAVRRGRDGR